MTFRREARSTADDSVAGAGVDELLLDERDRERVDDQFIEG